MTTLEIKEFKHAIVEFTNSKDLPLEIKRLVFSEILQDLTQATEQELQIQLSERAKLERATEKKGDK